MARQNGVASLYVRNLREASARALPGTEGADQPFFSPDGRWLAFFADARLKKISLAGAAPVVLAEAPSPRGGSWAVGDTIVFAPATTTGLLRIAADGGMPQAVTMPDRTLNEASHRWPHVLPDGETVLFAAGPTVSARNWIEAHVVVQSLKTGIRKVIAPSGAFPWFLRSGHVIYVQDGVAFAQPFDPSTWQTGEAAPVIDGVATLGGINGGAFQMALSSSGTLLAVPAAPHESQTFVWAYTSSESGIRQVYVRVADGGAAAVQVSTQGGDEPVWVHGGRELFFRQGDDFMVVAVERAGAGISVGTPIRLFRGDYAAGGVRSGFNVSPDGRRLLLLKNGSPPADRTRFSVVLHWAAELDSLMRQAEP